MVRAQPRPIIEGLHADVRREVLRRRRRAPDVDVWAEIDRELDPASARPRLHPGVEVALFTRRNGTRYGMLKTPRGPAYVTLSEQDLDILKLIDGRRTVAEIVVEGLRTSGSLELSAVTDLVEDLRVGGFLEHPHVEWRDRLTPTRSTRRLRLPQWVKNFLATRKIEFPGADRFFRTLYRAGGWVFFTRPFAVGAMALSLAGVAAFVIVLARGGYTLIGRSGASILVLYLILLGSTFIHESGHALACIHHRRRVNGAGFMLYLGMPAFYIETTDMWMASRRGRVVASAAGPFSEAVLAGASSLMALVLPVSLAGALMYRFAVLSYISIAKNLVPFLRLDGYYVLMDLLEEVNIREQAFAFVREELTGKVGRREGMTRRQRLYVTYTAIALAAAAGAVALSVVFWTRVFRQGFRNAADGGPWALALVSGLVALLLAPLVRLALRGVVWVGREVRAVGRRLRRRAQRRWRSEAAALIARMPLLTPLPDEALAEVEDDVDLVRVAAGRWVFRQGDVPDRFYVVRSGRLHVATAEEEGRILARLGPGDSFGELSLLEGIVRTAGVMAVEETEVFAVSRGMFDRHIVGRLEVSPDLRRSAVSPGRLGTLPPFRHLAEDELLSMAASARRTNVAPGARIVKQGDEGRSFFVIESGQVDVIKDRRLIGVLGPGDHFGEVALLTDEPRAATVRARTAVSVVEVDRSSFERTLAGGFRRARIRPGQSLVRRWEH